MNDGVGLHTNHHTQGQQDDERRRALQRMAREIKTKKRGINLSFCGATGFELRSSRADTI